MIRDIGARATFTQDITVDGGKNVTAFFIYACDAIGCRQREAGDGGTSVPASRVVDVEHATGSPHAAEFLGEGEGTQALAVQYVVGGHGGDPSSVEEVGACARGRGVTALYALEGGVYAAYILGAPGFVNRPFSEL